MKGDPVRYGDFVVYPEYCEFTAEYFLHASKDGKFHIAAIPADIRNCGVVFKDGKLIWSRPKYRLYKTEIEVGVEKGMIVPRPTNLGSWNTLILICYEIMFPHDYLFFKRSGQPDDEIDLIVHMVGFPMSGENQREGWIAMQDTLSMLYNCPLICCCGGPPGRMNISRIIDK